MAEINKSILVFDTPKSCRECPCCICTEFDTYCGMSDMQLEYDFEQCAYVKPDWCPIKELPEKMEGDNSIKYQWGDYEDGYNHCIDEILGG